MDLIRLNKVSLFAYHGVLPEERERGQEFIVSVEMETDLEGISNTDDLSHTVNYADVTEIIKNIVQGKPCNLIETLAEKIALALLNTDKINSVQVTVEKPRPPLPAVTGGASVTVKRQKSGFRSKKTIFLGLGSNLKDRLSFLNKTVEKLNAHAQIKVTNMSSVYETDPVGGTMQGRYLNAVCAVTTDLSPEELLKVTKKIEYDMGRRKKGLKESRFIDIDILIYPDTIISSENLNLPHPLLAQRWFVLVPLAEIAPGLIPPGYSENIAQLLKNLGEPEGIDKLETDSP